jgi:ligand-binding sensor domain-containing protein
MKASLKVLILFLLPFLWTQNSFAFDKPLAKVSTGIDSPHILKKDEYSLNTRNIKVLTAHDGQLWMGTAMGVIRYNTATVEDYEVFDNRNVLLSNGIFSIKLDRQGLPWIGTYGGGLSHFDGKNWINLNTPDGLCDSFVYDVEFTSDGMWIATWSGANRVTGDPLTRSSWKSFTVENTSGGLIDDWVYAIEIGKNGNVWFGTESGLSMFDGKTWRKWNHKDGLGAPLEKVEKDNRGVMSSFKGGHHAGHSPDLPNMSNPDYRPNYIVSMLLDQKGRLWIGTWGGGLSVLDTTTLKFRNYSTRDGLPGNVILAIKEGPRGDLWIGSNGGLSRFDGTTFSNYSKTNGLSGNFVFSIEFDPAHSVWLGGHFGMNRLKLDPADGKLMRFN